MPEQKQKSHIAQPVKAVVLHPIISDYIDHTQKVLQENGNDASYSVAVNAVLLMAIMESKRPGGLSKETREAVKDFVEDQSTIQELVSMESELSFSANPKARVCYIS